MQQVLSRLLTDPTFREAFFGDPVTASGAYDLTPKELCSLAQLHEKRVGTHAFLLAHERVLFALNAFPVAATVLRPLSGELADKFARAFTPVPSQLPRMDLEAPRFAGLVDRLIAAGELGPAYLADVVHCELTIHELVSSEEAWSSAERALALRQAGSSVRSPDTVLASMPVMGRHVALRAFEHDVVHLIDRLRGGEVPETAHRLPTIVLFTRTVAPPAVARARVNGLTRELLGLCDGTRTCPEVAATLAEIVGVGNAGLARFEHRTMAALSRLFETRVLLPGALPGNVVDDYAHK